MKLLFLTIFLGLTSSQITFAQMLGISPELAQARINAIEVIQSNAEQRIVKVLMNVNRASDPGLSIVRLEEELSFLKSLLMNAVGIEKTKQIFEKSYAKFINMTGPGSVERDLASFWAKFLNEEFDIVKILHQSYRETMSTYFSEWESLINNPNSNNDIDQHKQALALAENNFKDSLRRHFQLHFEIFSPAEARQRIEDEKVKASNLAKTMKEDAKIGTRSTNKEANLYQRRLQIYAEVYQEAFVHQAHEQIRSTVRIQKILHHFFNLEPEIASDEIINDFIAALEIEAVKIKEIAGNGFMLRKLLESSEYYRFLYPDTPQTKALQRSAHFLQSTLSLGYPISLRPNCFTDVGLIFN